MAISVHENVSVAEIYYSEQTGMWGVATIIAPLTNEAMYYLAKKRRLKRGWDPSELGLHNPKHTYGQAAKIALELDEMATKAAREHGWHEGVKPDDPPNPWGLNFK